MDPSCLAFVHRGGQEGGGGGEGGLGVEEGEGEEAAAGGGLPAPQIQEQIADKAVDVPVIMLHKFLQSVPQIQFIDRVLDIPVMPLRQVRTVPNCAEVGRVLGKVVDAPVVVQGPVPGIPNSADTVEVPLLQFIDSRRHSCFGAACSSWGFSRPWLCNTQCSRRWLTLVNCSDKFFQQF